MMRLYDSSLKQKVIFTPIKEGEVRMYICGPTVYDDAHLGHARSAVSFDLLARFLEVLGYEVLVAKNFTDIDDKIINKSRQSGIAIEELTSTYTKAYLNDMAQINVRRANLEPKATQFIEQIGIFIKDLIDKDIAYYLPNGDICLEVAKDSRYGNLSGHIESEEAIHRVEVQEGKRDWRDFVLWKSAKDDEVGYESILGRGRPGWHIECSAMIDSILSYSSGEFCIDIHAGGLDLFFPHHENEASQTRCFRDMELAKYWLHNGFVNINGEKMSKSLGNSFFMKDALKIYHGEILRNYLISTHYRSSLNFNEEDLLNAKKRLDKIYRLKKRIDYKIPDELLMLNEKDSSLNAQNDGGRHVEKQQNIYSDNRDSSSEPQNDNHKKEYQHEVNQCVLSHDASIPRRHVERSETSLQNLDSKNIQKDSSPLAQNDGENQNHMESKSSQSQPTQENRQIVSSSADYGLQDSRGEHGTPPISEKSGGFFGVRGSGVGEQPFFAPKEENLKQEKSKEIGQDYKGNLESANVDSNTPPPSTLPQGEVVSLGKDSSLNAQNDNVDSQNDRGCHGKSTLRHAESLIPTVMLSGSETSLKQNTKKALINKLKQNADKALKEGIIESLSDDLNISLALSHIDEFIKNTNEYLDSNPKDKDYKQSIAHSLAFIDFTLGLGMIEYVEYFQLGVSKSQREIIERLLQERLEAKKNKDFAKADHIRDTLLQEGIAIMDKAGGISEWERIYV